MHIRIRGFDRGDRISYVADNHFYDVHHNTVFRCTARRSRVFQHFLEQWHHQFQHERNATRALPSRKTCCSPLPECLWTWEPENGPDTADLGLEWTLASQRSLPS